MFRNNDSARESQRVQFFPENGVTCEHIIFYILYSDDDVPCEVRFVFYYCTYNNKSRQKYILLRIQQ